MMTLKESQTEIRRLEVELAAAQQQASDAWSHAHKVYEERDALVSVLSKLLPAHLMPHHNKRTNRAVCCIHLPGNVQVAWHIPEDRQEWFDHLQPTENHWDKHTSADRLERLIACRVPD